MSNFITRLFAPRSDGGSAERNVVQWLLQSESTGATADSKEAVNFSTSLTVAAYYAAIKAISEDLAKLPLKIYNENPDGTKTLDKGPVYQLLNTSPNSKMTAFSYRQTIMAHKLAWGNSYSEIERNGFGEPVALHIIHPSRMNAKEVSGKVVYDVATSDGPAVVLPSENVLHVKGLSETGIVGLSVMAMSTQCLGLNIAAQRYAAAFYGNSARPSGVISFPGKLNSESAKRLRESWQSVYSTAKNAGKVAVLEEGSKWESLAIPPNEAQFLETRQFQVEEVARWFRIPLHKLQHLLRSTYSNIEHQGMEYVEDCLMSHAVCFEKEVTWKLLNNDSRYAKHLFAAMLRGDSKSRGEYYTKMFNLGTLSPNDIRRLEDMDPIKVDGADSYYIQLNMQRIDRLPKQVEEKQRSMPPNKTSMIAMAAFIRNQERVFGYVIGKLTRKEVLAHSRFCVKMSPKEFVTWQAEFYTEHLSQVVDSLKPLIVSMLDALQVKHNGELDTRIRDVFKPLDYASPELYSRQEQALVDSRSKNLMEGFLRSVDHA